MYNKYYQNLSENWFIDKDPENRGLERGWNCKISETAVPTPIPAIIQEVLPEYHGVAFYWCKLVPAISCGETERLILRFNGVDYKATVWLNGELLGEHEGGEDPFEFDVTEKISLEAENLIAVKVINPIEYDIDGLNLSNVANRNKTIEKMAGCCLNSGGIWYNVELYTVPEVYIEDKFFIGDIHTGKLTAKVDIKNISKAEADATLTLNVYGKTTSTNKITEASKEIKIKSGDVCEEISVVVPDVRLWDINDPFLYRVEIVLTSDSGEHRASLNFGFREFLVKDGYFYLNGRKIFLKSAHSGNAFPVGQNYPVVKEQVRQDMVMAKTYGFNMVRSIAGTFRPEQIDVCDEIGLLVYEECMASWQVGEFRGMLKDQENSDLDPEKMHERFRVCTNEMVKRDRNHASVVIWCLLNEMLPNNPVTPYAEKYLPELRKYDPSRLVLLQSGRWDANRAQNSASNPYSDTWNAPMGMDGTASDKVDMHNGIAVFGIGDYHFYPDYPLGEKDVKVIREYSKDGLPAFISESGIGPLFNVIEESKHFRQYGYREDLEDFSWLTEQSNKLEADWKRFGLEKIYPYAEMMLKESQRLSALDRRLIFDAIRSNPKHNGYSLTGLLDHGMCGEGLWSFWRRFKPEVYDTVCDGWEPLRFCLFVKHHVYSGEEFEIEAVLANESVLKPGKYTADFAITGENGTVEMFSEDFEIKDDSFAVPVMKKNIKLNVPTGKYSLIAYLRNAGSPLGNKLDFYVRNTADIPKTSAKVYFAGVEETTVEFLKNSGATVEKFNGQTDGTVILGQKIDEDTIILAKKCADKGAKVLALTAHSFRKDSDFRNLKFLGISEDLSVFTIRDWLYHKESVASNGEVFNSLGLGICDSIKYGQSYPRFAYMTSRTPDEIICPAFYVGSPHVNGAYASAHTIAGFNSGNGKIYLNCFRLEENLGKNPAADIVLVNLINYISK